MDGVRFISKEPGVLKDPYMGGNQVSVFMVVDGKEYFVTNKLVVEYDGSLYAMHANDREEAIIQSAYASKGKFAKFYGVYETPLDEICALRDRGGGFWEPENLFDSKFGAEGYGEGFFDFSGNGPKIWGFKYRIFSREYLEVVKRELIPLLPKKARRIIEAV